MASVAVERLIEAPRDAVFEAWTRSAVLHMWLCDVATAVPHRGGRVYLAWHGGYHSAGEFVAVDPPRSLAFTWRGPEDAVAGRVSVTLDEAAPSGDARTRTLARLEHEVPDGQDGAEALDALRDRWTEALDNLAFALDTGADRRVTRRPLLGIEIDELTPAIAEAEGVPVHEGIRLGGVVAGLGAETAGLQAHDVIVEVAGRTITGDFSTFAAAIHGKVAGDRLDVTYYRGPERRTTVVELSGRQVAEISWEPAELAGAVRGRYDAVLAALEATLAAVPEDVSARRPGPDEWSADEVLAHLVLTERQWLVTVDDLVTGWERNADGWGGNVDAHVVATSRAYGSAAALLRELRTLEAELVACLGALPETFAAHRALYGTLARQALEQPEHAQLHLAQIEAAIRGASPVGAAAG